MKTGCYLATSLFFIGCTQPVEEETDTPDVDLEPYLFDEMSLTILDNLVEHSVTDDFHWLHSETGDTAGFAPRTLFTFAEPLDRADLADIALGTADLYLEVAPPTIQAWLAGETVDSADMTLAMAGAPALIDAYVHTGDPTYLDYLSINSRLISALIINDLSLIEAGGDFSFYHPMFIGGALITMNAEIALAIAQVQGSYDEAAEVHLGQGSDLVEALDSYLTPGGYYALSESASVSAFYNANMAMALTAMYRATDEPDYLERANTLFEAMNPLWDVEKGAYLNDGSSSYIGLAENNSLMYGHLMLGEVDRVQAFYGWVEESLFRELPDGYAVMLHDNEGVYGEWYWCSGCNFLALYNIWLLNKTMGNEPISAE
ncbi:MAG: hypothetical protein HN348_03795 [Proteobacteria bacterium]|jgi:hypothetical protein|nr:hypothetical protein [Pseudomonadota bacterium]